MTAEELMYQAEHMRLENPNDGTRLLFFALQAQAIIAEQLTRIADRLQIIGWYDEDGKWHDGLKPLDIEE